MDVKRNLKQMTRMFHIKSERLVIVEAFSFDAKQQKRSALHKCEWWCIPKTKADVSNDFFSLPSSSAPSPVGQQMCWLFPVCKLRLCGPSIALRVLLFAVVLIGLEVSQTGFRVTFYGKSPIGAFFIFCLARLPSHLARFNLSHLALNPFTMESYTYDFSLICLVRSFHSLTKVLDYFLYNFLLFLSELKIEFGFFPSTHRCCCRVGGRAAVDGECT